MIRHRPDERLGPGAWAWIVVVAVIPRSIFLIEGRAYVITLYNSVGFRVLKNLKLLFYS